MTHRLLLLNGPNLDLLGTREPDLYGHHTLADVEELVGATAARAGWTVEAVQSNHEGVIIDAVHAQLPDSFHAAAAAKGTEGTKPLPPAEALRTLKTKPGLAIELVASEPLVQSPVAIDWGPDGRLWVCEMFDYPTGVDEKWKAGGRIKVLTDTDGDGRYDKAEVFLDGLPFPTGFINGLKHTLKDLFLFLDQAPLFVGKFQAAHA